MTESTKALSFRETTKRFGATCALDRVSFDVAPGEILGLVGRNGAGKTTALRLAHGFYRSDAGAVRTLGMDPETEGHQVRQRVSLMSDEDALYPWMKVRELFRFVSKVHPTWDTELARSH